MCILYYLSIFLQYPWAFYFLFEQRRFPIIMLTPYFSLSKVSSHVINHCFPLITDYLFLNINNYAYFIFYYSYDFL